MTWQFIPFLILAGLLMFGMYKFRAYLNAKDAAHAARVAAEKAQASSGGGNAGAAGPHPADK